MVLSLIRFCDSSLCKVDILLVGIVAYSLSTERNGDFGGLPRTHKRVKNGITVI